MREAGEGSPGSAVTVDPSLTAVLSREVLLRPLFRLGDTEVALATLGVALAILLGGWGLAEAARATLLALARRRDLPRAVGRVLGEAAYFWVVGVAVLVALASLGLDLLAGVVVLAVAGFALALGLQDTLSNIVAGIAIAMDGPFRVGDRVRVAETSGVVEVMGLRATRILTEEGARVTVPNRLIVTREVWNLTPRPSPARAPYP